MGLAGERIINNFKFYAVFRKTRSLPSGANRPSWARLSTRHHLASASPSRAIAGSSRKWTGSVTPSLPRRSRAVCRPTLATAPVTSTHMYSSVCARRSTSTQHIRTLWVTHGPAWRRLVIRPRFRAREPSRSSTLGGDTWVLFPWLGSYAFLALERMLKIKCAAGWVFAGSTRHARTLCSLR